MKYGKIEMIVGAIRRPDLALRFLRGHIPSEYGLEEVARWVESQNPVVVEAGAFDGQDTLAFARRWPGGKIHAFEPLPSLATRVRTTTLDCTNVVVYETALATNASPTVELYTFDNEHDAHGSSSILQPGDHLVVAPEIKFQRRVSVAAMTLDVWHESVNSPKIDLLWLDLQGAELQVLNHGKAVLSATRVIHIEVSRKPLYEGGATFSEVKDALSRAGFRLVSSRIPVRSGNAIFVRI